MMKCIACAKEIPDSNTRGRPRRYCSRSCRQRAYRDRRARNSGAGRPAIPGVELTGIGLTGVETAGAGRQASEPLVGVAFVVPLGETSLAVLVTVVASSER